MMELCAQKHTSILVSCYWGPQPARGVRASVGERGGCRPEEVEIRCATEPHKTALKVAESSSQSAI